MMTWELSSTLVPAAECDDDIALRQLVSLLAASGLGRHKLRHLRSLERILNDDGQLPKTMSVPPAIRRRRWAFTSASPS